MKTKNRIKRIELVTYARRDYKPNLVNRPKHNGFPHMVTRCEHEPFQRLVTAHEREPIPGYPNISIDLVINLLSIKQKRMLESSLPSSA